MSFTKSFFSNLRFAPSFFLIVLSAVVPTKVWSQAVPSQANIDASAQRRLQEMAREAQRQRRIEDLVRDLSAALPPGKLEGSDGPVLARKALAALIRLREEGISPDEALNRAARSTGLATTQTAKPATYLRNLFTQKSGQITPAILAKLETGQNPAPELVLSPFVP